MLVGCETYPMVVLDHAGISGATCSSFYDPVVNAIITSCNVSESIPENYLTMQPNPRNDGRFLSTESAGFFHGMKIDVNESWEITIHNVTKSKNSKAQTVYLCNAYCSTPNATIYAVSDFTKNTTTFTINNTFNHSHSTIWIDLTNNSASWTSTYGSNAIYPQNYTPANLSGPSGGALHDFYNVTISYRWIGQSNLSYHSNATLNNSVFSHFSTVYHKAITNNVNSAGNITVYMYYSTGALLTSHTASIPSAGIIVSGAPANNYVLNATATNGTHNFTLAQRFITLT